MRSASAAWPRTSNAAASSVKALDPGASLKRTTRIFRSSSASGISASAPTVFNLSHQPSSAQDPQENREQAEARPVARGLRYDTGAAAPAPTPCPGPRALALGIAGTVGIARGRRVAGTNLYGPC